MPAILDHVDDINGAELRRLAQLYTLPEFVKKASSDDLYPDDTMTPTIYVDQVTRKFPCHNAASTWLSALYFAEKIAEYQPPRRAQMQSRLDSFVKYWGIKDAVDSIHSTDAYLYKAASDTLPDDDFGFVWLGEDGKKQRHLRMKSAAEVKVAAQWLLTYRDTLPFGDRNTIATKILEKAAHYGASLDGTLEQFIEKQAGHGVCEPTEVVAMIKQRATFVKTAAERQTMEKMAELLEKSPRYALQPGMLVELTKTVEAVDLAVGLAGKYTDIIQRPEDVIFKVTYKEAADSVGNAVSLTTGNIYDRNQFTKLALNDLKDYMGSELAREVTAGVDIDVEKLATVAETFPRPDAEMFEQILRDSGIQPIQRKTAGDWMGIRHPGADGELEALANAY